MAYEAMSPFGISWGYLALLLLPLLLAAMGAVVSVRRLEMNPWVSLLMLVAATAGLWTFFTVGAPVTVQVPEDPQGAECLVNTFGNNPGRVVRWHTDCGQAVAVHMAASAGPTVVMLGALIAATAHGVQRRERAGPAR